MGQYDIGEKIGQGGMGVVFRARQRTLNRTVAIKFLPGAFIENEVAVKRFEREVRLASRLTHPNIVTIYDFGVWAGAPEEVSLSGDWESLGGSATSSLPFYVMEYVQGRTLQEVLEESPPGRTALMDRIFRQVLDAIAHIHEAGLLHRDIKSANIMVDPTSNARLMDFGLAKDRLSDRTALTEEGRILGTPRYMAPEIFRGDLSGPHVDIWALGILYYMILTGEPPFDGDSKMDLARSILVDPLPSRPSTVEPAAWTFIEALLAKDPRKRPADGCAALALFDELLGAPGGRREASGRTRSARAVSPASSFATSAPSRSRIVGTMILAGGLMGAMMFFRRSADPTRVPSSVATHSPTATPPDLEEPIGDDPLEVLELALFRFRASGRMVEICRELEPHREVTEARARLLERIETELNHGIETTGLRAALEGYHTWRDAHLDAVVPEFLPSSMDELTLLAGSMETVRIDLGLPEVDLRGYRLHPIVRPRTANESVTMVFDPQGTTGLPETSRRTVVEDPQRSALFMMIPGGSTRETLFASTMRKGRENPWTFRAAKPLPLRLPAPDEWAVVHVHLRYFSPAESLDVTLTDGDGTVRSRTRIMRRRPGRGNQFFHLLDGTLLDGPRWMKIEYDYCASLGFEGDCLVYSVSVHYLPQNEVRHLHEE